MKPEKNTLVIVQPLEGNPEKPCWGFIQDEIVTPRTRKFIIRISPKETIIVYAGQAIPIMPTDVSAKDPNRFARKIADQLLIDILRKLFVQRETKELIKLIQDNTLVIVLPRYKIHKKACFGVVIGKILGEKYKVVIGTSFKGFRKETISVEADQLIPVIQTDGSTLNPARVVRRNWHKIIMHIILRLHTTNGASALQRLLSSLSIIEKDLLF